MTSQPRVEPRWLSRTELVAGVAVAAWLQVVGVVTTQVLHHVLHALPLAVLLALPKNRWVRLTSMLAGFAWIFMLAVITPMIHHAVVQGGLWRDPGVFVWLAPIAAILSALWAAINLALLANPRWLPCFLAGFVALVPVLGSLFPRVRHLFEPPLQKALEGNVPGGAVLAAELIFTLAVPWLGVVVLTRRTDLLPTRQALAWQALFWAFFLACMIAGLLPSLNP